VANLVASNFSNRRTLNEHPSVIFLIQNEGERQALDSLAMEDAPSHHDGTKLIAEREGQPKPHLKYEFIFTVQVYIPTYLYPYLRK
jgi:hypothetical protein